MWLKINPDDVIIQSVVENDGHRKYWTVSYPLRMARLLGVRSDVGSFSRHRNLLCMVPYALHTLKCWTEPYLKYKHLFHLKVRGGSRVQRPSFWWPEEVCRLFLSQCHWLLGKILPPRPSIACFEGPHYALICFSASCRQLLCWVRQLKSTNSERCTGWLVYLISLVGISLYFIFSWRLV